MEDGKAEMEEEESFLSLLLNNQHGYSLAVADTLVGQSFEPVNVEKSAEAPLEKGEEEEGDEKPIIRFRKAIPPHVLRELTVNDPKRARRIIANRLSAARAKEKKKLHINVLENEVQNLQNEWNSTSAQLSLIQSESQNLTEENSRLKERATMVVQRINLQDELNEQIRKEVQYMRTMMGYCALNFSAANAVKPPADNGGQK